MKFSLSGSSCPLTRTDPGRRHTTVSLRPGSFFSFCKERHCQKGECGLDERSMQMDGRIGMADGRRHETNWNVVKNGSGSCALFSQTRPGIGGASRRFPGPSGCDV